MVGRTDRHGSGGALHPSETSHRRDFCFLRLRVKALTPLEDRSARGTHASGDHSDQAPDGAKRPSGQPKWASIFLVGVATARGRTRTTPHLWGKIRNPCDGDHTIRKRSSVIVFTYPGSLRRARGDAHARFADFHRSRGCARSTLGSPSDMGPDGKRLAVVLFPDRRLCRDHGRRVKPNKGMPTSTSHSPYDPQKSRFPGRSSRTLALDSLSRETATAELHQASAHR